MRTLFNMLLAAVALLLASSCVLGDEGIEQSPYEHAFFGEVTTSGVADGLTPVSVTVYGDEGVTLTLQVVAAEFVAGVSEVPRSEKTVQLVDVDERGFGFAEVELVSSNPGLATISFKLAPVAVSLEVEFEAVGTRVDVPVPLELRPGSVAHEVCIYANTRYGTLRVQSDRGSLIPENSPLDSTEAQLRCATDEEGWPGVALFEWTSAEAIAQFEVRHTGVGDEGQVVQSTQVRGVAFPGYDAILLRAERNDSWAQMHVRLSYRETPEFINAAAATVALDGLRSIPSGLSLVGSSSGDESAVPQTDSEGGVVLYFEIASALESLSVFATPDGGGTLFLGELPASPEAE